MKLKDISKTYHNKHSDVLALNHVSLEIERTGIVAIVGSSGCGKTTLLHILSGQDTNFEGERIVDGTVEVIEQEIMLFEAMNVQDNLRMICDDKQKIDCLLTKFQMREFSGKKVKKLSVGQKKRVQVMRSILRNPDYLLCDEPTAALDHDNAEIVMQMLQQVSKNICVIVVTHDIDLVKQYADQVITMQKGYIEKMETLHTRSSFTPKAHTVQKKAISDHLFLFGRLIKSRIGEQLLSLVLVFVLCLSVFGSFLFNSVNQTVDGREKWRTGGNILTPQPNQGNNVFRDSNDRNAVEELEYPTGSFYYDLYSDEDVQLVKDNIPEVIGYRCGWNVHLYSQYGTWIPRIYYNQAVDLIQKADAEIAETGRSYTELESYLKNRLESISEEEKNSDQFYVIDYTNQNKINNQTSVLREDDSLLFDPLLTEDANIHLYQIFDDCELPVQYGKWMETDNEIVVPYNVAAKIQQIENMASPEEVLGITCSVTLPKRSGNNFSGVYESQTIATFTIVGIAYYGNDTEDQIFLREGVWNKLRAQFYGFQDDVNYQYIEFIIDTQADTEQVAKKLNELLDSTESHFVTKSASASVREDYQNAALFHIFIVSICVIMAVLLIISHLITRKRERKELLLIRWYGYHPFLIMLWKVAAIFLAVGVIQILSLPYISTILNQFASSLGFDSMLSQDISRYLFSWGISLLLVFLIESAFQRTRKRR